jgi:hypothetical protein
MVAHVQRALGKRAVVAEHVGLDLLRIGHLETRRTADQFALVAHLAAAFGVERRGVEHHDPALPGFQLGHADAVKVQRDDLGGPFFQVLIAGEGVAGAAVLQRLVHLELASRAALGLLLLHGGGKAGAIHLDAGFAANVSRQVQREAIGVVQLEGHVAGQHLGSHRPVPRSRISIPVASVSKKRSSSTRSTSVMRFSSCAQLGIGVAHQRTRSATSLWKNGVFLPSL